MTLLITGGTQAARLEAAKKYPALEFDVSGIEDIRQLEKIISTGRGVIITNAQTLTQEAQNAFLKTLEEAQSDIVLLADNEDQLLPTVVSRCFVVNLSSPPVAPRDVKKTLEKLKEVTDRTEAIQIIDQLLASQEELLRSGSSSLIMRELFKTKKYLKANANVRLALDNLP